MDFTLLAKTASKCPKRNLLAVSVEAEQTSLF